MGGPTIGSMMDDESNRALIADVTALLDALFSDSRSGLSTLDRWTERRIREENLAKAALVAEADDPVEHCYQNLIREIDTEARNGIFLANPAAGAAKLRHLAGDSGVSGRLNEHVAALAPRLFPDETKHSGDTLDLVWTGLHARYDRAHLEAQVSEMVMSRLLGDDEAMDMTDALRGLFFAYHEDRVRRSEGLEVLLGDREAADLGAMVAELAARSGDYDERVRLICARSGTA